MSSSYTSKDFYQSLIGIFDMGLFYFVLRAGEPMPFLDSFVGIGITLVWLYILYNSFKIHNGEHFFINLVVSFTFCVLMTLLFKIATWEQILANPFGSPAMVFTWIHLPIALIMDKNNISNILRRYYIR